MTAVHDKTASPEPPRIPSWISRLRLVLGLYGLIGGAISFLGWALDIQKWTDWINSGVSIQPNSAIAVTAAGAAILSLALGMRWLSLPLGLLVALVGLTAGFQLLTGIDLGINTLFMFGRDWGGAGAISPGQMGTPGFTSWSLIGIAVVLASIAKPVSGNRIRTIAVLLAIITTAISTLSLTGFLYGATTLYTLPLLTVIAMQTATFVLALSTALIFCITDVGPARLLGEQSAAGLMARRVVPTIILVPILLGFVRLAGEKAGFYDLAFGTAARTLVEITLLLALLALTARAVSRQTQRAEAQEMALRGLADAMPHVVWIADADGKVQYYNDRVSGWEGIVPTAGNTYDGNPGLHEEDREETQAVWQKAVSESHTYEREHRILMQDGTYRWHLSRATPVTTAAGKVWYGTATDIHEVKTAGQMIRESEQRFASFMQHLPGLAWIKDRFGRYVYVNEAAEKAFHFPQKDLYGKTDAEVFPPETAAAFAENDQRALESGTGIQVIETLKDDEGNPRESLVSKFPILAANAADGPLIGGMAIDITEQRKAQVNQDFLFTIAEMLRVGRSAEQMLTDIANAVGKYLGAHRCFFNEIDIENDTGVIHADYARLDRSLSGKYKLSDYSSLSTFDNMIAGQTVVNRDSKTDPRTSEIFESVYEPNKERSYITVPMLREGKWVASFWCSDDAPRDWTAPEIALLEGVAERTWTAVERLRTDALLRGREYMFSTLVEAAPFGVYFIDSEFRLTSINSGAKAVFAGIEPLIGRDFEEILRIVWPEPFATDALQKFRHTLETGEPYYSLTLSQERSNVSDAESYDWQLHRITLDDGRDGVVCYFYDLTQQIQLEAAVRDSEERFRLAQQAGNVGIWDWDIAKGRTYWSEQMWTLYDESPRDIDPDIEFWNSHLHVDDRKAALDTFERTLAGGAEHHDAFRIVRKDGTIRWIESIATVERDDAGKARRMYGVNLDITELQVAHDELEVRVVERTQELAKANTMLLQQMEERAFIEDQRIRLLKRLFTVQEDERGRIARDIHDHLGQRLTALRLKIASVRALCEGQELLEQRVNRLQEISEILDKEVSFLAWELRPEILDKTDFVHALEQYVNEWSRHSDVFAEFTVIGLKDAELDKDIENNLYRITQEALNNAAKYAQAKQINVILEQRAEELLLIIEDDGIGFDVAATSAESSSTKGFGLVGLRERASLIGGTIEIESALEKGTTIFIRVPLAQENKG